MKLLFVVSCAALVVTAQVPVSARLKIERQPSQVTKPQTKGSEDDDIVPEESESSNPQVREARRAKDTRYNGGGADLTVDRPPGSEIFFDQTWPALGFIPVSESAVIAVGMVVKVQPYLSSDRSRIYTEFTIRVDSLLKRDRDNRLSAQTLVIDQLGGKLKLKTGRIVSDNTHLDYLGKPQFGRRYVLFGQSVNDGSDISLIKSYELLDGKILTNDSRPRRLISTFTEVPENWVYETIFLEAIRQEIRKETRPPKTEK